MISIFSFQIKFLVSATALIGLFLTSCTKKDALPPSNSNNLSNDAYSLAGQKWLLYQYRVGQVAVNYTASDTLEFFTPTSYSFNNDTSTYSLYSVPGSFKLNLNGTLWGNISGTLFDYNITNGDIEGLRFTETFSGSQAEYYLWMARF